MKKLLQLLFIFTLMLAACGKKNDSAPDPSSRIIGKWKNGSSSIVFTTAGKEVYRQSTAAVVTNDYSEFRAGGVVAAFTYVSSSNSYTESDNTWSISGNILHVTIQNQTSDYTFSFTDDNTLNLSLSTAGTFSYPVSATTTANADNVTLNIQLNKF